MAISIFPSTAAEFVSNNFVVDMNDSTNNTADTGGVKQAGPYSISFSSGDTSFDVYLIDEDGNSVGYSNNTSIIASGLFSTVVILGVAQDEVVSFLYQGSVNNADGEGDEPGAGAYLESISPSDLPSIDDTATVIGGNFGADTEITFESGATVLPAKSITVVSGTELLVTRPDGLIEDDAPYTVRAVTTGVPQPTGTNSNILTDAVTAGSDPTWVTTSPLNTAVLGAAFSQTLEATDSEGTVVDYSVTAGTLIPGLTLDATSGVLSGTATSGGNFTFTVTATDDGGNETDKQFEQAAQTDVVGGEVFFDATHEYRLFTSSDTLEIPTSREFDYLIVAGGGSGGGSAFGKRGAGGGGAGGRLSGTLTTSGTLSVAVGAGGNSTNFDGNNGSDSSISTIDTAVGGGGGGGNQDKNGKDGGSGGGGGFDSFDTRSSGVAGQGFAGGILGTNNSGGGGGGATQQGFDGGIGDGGDGDNAFSTWASAVELVFDGGFFAGGGGGGANSQQPNNVGAGGSGGGGNGSITGNGSSGQPNSGGGGGGGGVGSSDTSGGAGGSGVVIARFAL